MDRRINLKNRCRQLLTGATRHPLVYEYLLRYVERSGLFVAREREWMKLTAARQSSPAIERIAAELTVIHGPFAGMRYPTATAVGSTLFPKLLGSYERELQPIVEAGLSASYAEIVDVGCAEGYYAIGFALKLPGCQVWAYDAEPVALDSCRKMAEWNRVSDRVALDRFCGPKELLSLPLNGRALIISDCEGFEKALFPREICRHLAKHDILIEVHDFRDPSISGALRSALADSHDIDVIRTIPDRLRTDIFPYEELASLNWETRTALLAELRPASMEWFFCRSRVRN